MAVHIFMKIDDIKGESIDANFTDQIEVSTWSWGMTQSGTAHSGHGTGTAKVTVQDVSFTKYVDRATPILVKYCCKGTYFKQAILTVCKAGNTSLPYLTLEMKDGLISGVHSGGAGDDERLVETVSLNFKSFKLVYKPQDKGAGKAEVPATWNIAKNCES